MTMPTIHQKICQGHSGGKPLNEKAPLPRMQAGPMAKGAIASSPSPELVVREKIELLAFRVDTPPTRPSDLDA